MALPLSYHWKHLLLRRTTTTLTVLVVAAVVGVFAWMVGFARALHGSLAMAQDDGKLVIIRRGATAETNSAIPVEDYARLNQLTALEREPGSNEPLLSPEMMVQVSLPRLRDGGRTWGNIAVRGVTEMAFKVHPNVRLTGRSFAPGSREVIVGLTAARQFAGLAIGDTLSLGYGNDREFRVVGYFTAGGGPAESEIWGYLPSLLNAYARSMYSSAALRIRPGADAEAVIREIQGPAIQLTAQTETQYWHEQSRIIRLYLKVAYVLVLIMSVAAVVSIANTMFSTVAGRTREIAMLQTIGYARHQILWGFVVESLFLSILGGVAGCLGCTAWLWLVGNTKDMFGASTFTTLAFEIHLTPATIAVAMMSVVVVGLLGSMFPARRAAGIGVVRALREG
jgi:putative ABC transport system permease protein